MAKTAIFLVLVLGAALVAGTGCVPFWIYHRAVKTNEDYVQSIDGHQKEHADLARRTKEAEVKSQSLELRNKELYEKLLNAEGAIGELEKEIRDRLPQVVETASVDLGLEKGVITVTPDRKISIAGDVLFTLGSTKLTAKAESILKMLAPMLKNEFKEAYIRIEGHTDDVPIKKPETLKKFPTNWHLSVGRAVSVLLELNKLGVPKEKMYAAGYGEFKPRVPNARGHKGAKENRRVEIAIVATK